MVEQVHNRVLCDVKQSLKCPCTLPASILSPKCLWPMQEGEAFSLVKAEVISEDGISINSSPFYNQHPCKEDFIVYIET